jgi:glycosyltransferase involved in cell wall biosynthesis
MPSRTPEPFGLVAAEAAFSGLPVILFGSSLLSQEVATMDLGFVPDQINAKSLAETLTRMAQLEPGQIRAMSERGYEKKAAFALSPDGWVDGLCDHYSAALSGVPAEL